LQGCFVDDPNSRILVVNSETDDDPSGGMTVEECVDFAQSQGLRYAGVEFGSQCFVGNTLHANITAPDSDCNMICAASNGTEFCGAGDRALVYLDNSWSDPTLQELTDVVVQYNSTLWQLQNLVAQYQALISEWAAQNNSTPPTRRHVVKRTLTAVQLQTQLTTIEQQYSVAQNILGVYSNHGPTRTTLM
jgi:hypothetical protein